MTPVKSSFGGLPLAAFNRAGGGQRTEGKGKGNRKEEIGEGNIIMNVEFLVLNWKKTSGKIRINN